MPWSDRALCRLIPLVSLAAACGRGGAPASLARIDTLHTGLIQGDQVRRRGSAMRRFGLDGNSIDTVLVPRREDDSKSWTFSSGSGSKNRAMMMTSVPFSPRVVQVLHPNGGFVIGWTGEYRILRSRTGEDTTMIMTRPWTPEPIPEAMRKKPLRRLAG